jgi:hypothetical protein
MNNSGIAHLHFALSSRFSGSNGRAPGHSHAFNQEFTEHPPIPSTGNPEIAFRRRSLFSCSRQTYNVGISDKGSDWQRVWLAAQYSEHSVFGVSCIFPQAPNP